MKLSNILFISICLILSLLWQNSQFSTIVAQSSITQNGPDLVVTTIEFDPPNPQSGDIVDIKVVVKNQGNQLAAPGFWNYLYLDTEDEPPTETTPVFANVYRGENLNPSETFTWWGLDYTYTGIDPIIYAVADPSWRNNVIGEVDEENNMLRSPLLEPAETLTPMPTIAADVPDAYELDDTCGDIADKPKMTTDGMPQTHNLISHSSSRLETDRDWIRFDATGGSVYDVRVTPNDPDLAMILSYEIFCDGQNNLGGAKIELRPEENVTYYLSITYDDTGQEIDTRYQVQVIERISELTATAIPAMPTPTSSPTNVPDTYELDDTCSDIADKPKITTDGIPQTHNLVSHPSSSLETDRDWVRFDATGGSIYDVRVTPNDPDLVMIIAYEIFCDGQKNLSGAKIELKPRENVTYYLSITYDDTGQEIDTRYQVQVTERMPEITATPVPATLSPTPSPTHTPSPTPRPDKTWVMLIYAVGDNDLARFLGMGENGMSYRLSKAGPQANVEVAVMYDGPDVGDTMQYLLNEDGIWDGKEMEEEAKMDESKTLQDFIQWGVEQYPDRDHYMLALLDHANGVIGFGQDLTSDELGQAFLTPQDIHDAIDNGLNRTNLNKFDIIHVDGCSFGLFENTFIFEGIADYVVASPNTGWALFPYKVYRRLAGESPRPLDYVQAAAAHYANEIAQLKYPYTISVYDMARYQTMHGLIDDFGKALHAYIDNNITAVEELKEQWKTLQKYDSNNYRLDFEDEQFVDLGHFVEELVTHENISVAHAARAIQNALSDFVVVRFSESGDFIDPYTSESIYADLDNAQGLGIYYPNMPPDPTANRLRDYLDNKIFFSLTPEWGWRDFLAEYFSIPLPTPPPPSTSFHPETMLAPLSLDPAFVITIEYKLYMPQVFR